jgi:hypothetical protein
MNLVDVIPAPFNATPARPYVIPARLDVIPAHYSVIPAKAGVLQWWRRYKIPAFAGMTLELLRKKHG